MKTMAKAKSGLSGFAAALILGFLLPGCSNVFNEKPAAPGLPPGGDDGTGYIQVNLGPDIRTLLPNAAELYYTLTYTEVSPGTREDTIDLGKGTSKTVSIPTGDWNLTVRGYRNPIDAGDPSLAAASGTSDSAITVNTSGNSPVTINLTGILPGSGILRYSISCSGTPAIETARMRLEKIGGTTRYIELAGAASSGQILNLEAGAYQVYFFLHYGNLTAAKGDAVHIYDNLETPVAFAFAAADFAESPDGFVALTEALGPARAAREGVIVSADGAGVPAAQYWVIPSAMAALDDAIAKAEKILTEYGAGRSGDDISAGKAALDAALGAFNGAKTLGTYDPTGDTALGLFTGGSTTAEAGTSDLATSLAWLKDNAASDTGYTIVIGADEALSIWILGGSGSQTNRVFAGKTGVTLTLKGKGIDRTAGLNAADYGYLFTVDSGVTLVLDEYISLRGRADNNASVIHVNTGGALTMNAGSKISGNTWLSGENSWGGGVTVDGGTFTMNGGEISGNSSTSTFGGTYYTAHGGGVHIGSGTFTMNGGEISGNSSKTYGGGVNIGSGTFTMNGGEISGNSSAVDGGGIYVEGGTFTLNAGGNIHGNTATYGGGVYSWASFTMNGGNISGNTATIYGGGVLVNGTCVFTMSGGNISGNTASRGGGLCIYGGTSTSTMSGAARVDLNNTVYINSIERFITIGAGGLTGSDPAALVEPAVNIGFIGKPAIKWQEGESGALPVDRFKFTSGWTADADGILNVKALPLTASGETAAAYLSGGSVHFYRFTPVLNKNYTITHTKPSGSNGIYTAAAWADGSGTLTTNTSSGSTSTSGSFNANKQVDIIIMVYNAAGDYTIKYTEQ